MTVKIEKNEYWWCGDVGIAHKMPFDSTTELSFDLNGNGREDDQFAPIMLSSHGRYIWSDRVFSASIKNGEIELSGKGDFVVKEGFQNLKGAYLAAMKEHFPFDGKMPDELFWKAPQYNTWIELGTDQTSEKIYAYAKSIVENGMTPGVLMIDGGWQEEYGVFEFNKGKVPDPKRLVELLHGLGFKVMLWVSPIVASAGTNFKKLRDRGYLVRDAGGNIAIREWWSGYSAVLDLTNPEAMEWFHSRLRYLMDEYGVDGFKFDAGDSYFYRDDDRAFIPCDAREQTAYFNKTGLNYSFNEYRAVWNFGGRAIVSRLHDKYHTWEESGLNTLIPHTIAQGLSGYAYCCPDMVGGGIIACFNEGQSMDEELFVRWAQANALMGMMQVSVAPWRVLSAENYRLVKDAVMLHSSYGELFVDLARHASATGEPIVRHMAYEFPDEGFERISDQFMVGDKILVAPVIKKGERTRSVSFPDGMWKTSDGKEFAGGCRIEVDAPADKLNFFIKSE